MAYFLAYLITCFLAGLFIWDRKPQQRNLVILMLALSLCFVYYVLHKL